MEVHNEENTERFPEDSNHDDFGQNEIESEDLGLGESIQKPFSPSDINIQTPPMNMGDLIDMIENGWINFGTEYQRAPNLWKPEQQSRLIESVLLGLRLPAFYFEAVEKRKWNIIDGQQRCCAIDNFCVKQSLALEHLEFLKDSFDGKKFGNLPFEIKRDIRMLPITVNVLQKGTPADVKYILFKRLNTGGIELKPQEIRNAVFSGIAIDAVAEMAKDDAFLKATCYKIPTLRKEDMDFISRFIAFYVNDYTTYEPDLESFINEGMKKINAGNVDLPKMKADFHKSMELAYRVFGDRAFRKQTSKEEKRKPLNKAIFEVFAVFFSRLSDRDAAKLISERDALKSCLWESLKKSLSFSNSFSSGTGMKSSVTIRFDITKNIINSILKQ